MPLLEDGVLTVSTIASAKGYDAPVVFLLGADELSGSTRDRATFYVGATRAKLHLVVTGVPQKKPTLLDEIMAVANALAGTPNKATTGAPSVPVRPPPISVGAKGRCSRCGSQRLHAQHGKFGYFFRCIDCTQNTPMDMICPKCRGRAKIRKERDDFHRECEACHHSELYHSNVPLGSLFE